MSEVSLATLRVVAAAPVLREMVAQVVRPPTQRLLRLEHLQLQTRERVEEEQVGQELVRLVAMVEAEC